MQNKSRAFTLIELLVVVLIIGILAAVAVPQYQSAVLKAKYANLVLLAETYAKAGKVTQLATGAWPSEFAALDVDLPGGVSHITNPKASNCGIFKEYYCCLLTYSISYQDAGVVCGLQNRNLGHRLSVTSEGNVIGRTCYASVNDAAASRVCKGVGTYVGTGANMPGPSGHILGVASYRY